MTSNSYNIFKKNKVTSKNLSDDISKVMNSDPDDKAFKIIQTIVHDLIHDCDITAVRGSESSVVLNWFPVFSQAWLHHNSDIHVGFLEYSYPNNDQNSIKDISRDVSVNENTLSSKKNNESITLDYEIESKGQRYQLSNNIVVMPTGQVLKFD